MYIIGEQIDDERFKLIYEVFDNLFDAKSFLIDTETTLKMVEFDWLIFPFFIIEEFENNKHLYYPTNKTLLNERIKTVSRLDDLNMIYFNLWRIENNIYNQDYPQEPFLNGKDWHLHFTNNDFLQIENNGFENYWQDILNT